MKVNRRQISKKMRELYDIDIMNILDDETKIDIHSPAFISVKCDNQFVIQNNTYTLIISNSKVAVTLSKNTERMHVTVYEY